MHAEIYTFMDPPFCQELLLDSIEFTQNETNGATYMHSSVWIGNDAAYMQFVRQEFDTSRTRGAKDLNLSAISPAS